MELSGADVLADEADRWKYFFASGCSNWFEGIKEYTFRSSFVELLREEAEVIVRHWESRLRLCADAEAGGRRCDTAALDALLAQAAAELETLTCRLDDAVQRECAASPAGLAFVKLSTRSPKDSKRALAKARAAYEARLSSLPACAAEDDNERWKILSEEVTRAGGVASGVEGLELLLDSERVYEDLEYALRGPKEESTSQAGNTESQATTVAYDMSIVARAWDPRLKLQSEFRGIAWDGSLTCLCQYFHPLFFPELHALKSRIESDCRELFLRPAVQATVESLGGHCIVDFAWLGPGDAIIVELNPFDGVCLGTFPASTGLFLWENESDQAIMKGEAPFELRVRDHALPSHELKNQCNPEWRRIIYRESHSG